MSVPAAFPKIKSAGFGCQDKHSKTPFVPPQQVQQDQLNEQKEKPTPSCKR